jgi:hypothetical protein
MGDSTPAPQNGATDQPIYTQAWNDGSHRVEAEAEEEYEAASPLGGTHHPDAQLIYQVAGRQNRFGRSSALLLTSGLTCPYWQALSPSADGQEADAVFLVERLPGQINLRGRDHSSREVTEEAVSLL